MEKEIENFINEAKGVKLTGAEKAAASKNVMNFVKANPAPLASGSGAGAGSAISSMSAPMIAGVAVVVAGLVAGGIFFATNSTDPNPIDDQDNSVITDDSVIDNKDGENDSDQLTDTDDPNNQDKKEDNNTQTNEDANIDTTKDKDDNYLYVEQDMKTLPNIVSICVREKFDVVVPDETAEDYKNRYETAKKFCEEQNTTNTDEVSQEKEITGDYGPLINQ